MLRSLKICQVSPRHHLACWTWRGRVWWCRVSRGTWCSRGWCWSPRSPSRHWCWWTSCSPATWACSSAGWSQSGTHRDQTETRAIFLFTDLWSSISLISETGSLKDTVSGDGSEKVLYFLMLCLREEKILTWGQNILPIVFWQTEDLRHHLPPRLAAGHVGVGPGLTAMGHVTRHSQPSYHVTRHTGLSQPSYHGKSITKLKWWKGQGKVGHKRGIKEANDDLVAFISTLLFFLEAQNYSSSFCILTPRDWLEKYMTHLIYLMSFTIQLSKLSKSQLLEGAGCL